MPCAISEVWTEFWFEATRLDRPPQGQALQVRRVPKGKLKQFLAVVNFRLKILILFLRLLSKEFGRADHLKQHVSAIHRKEKPFQCDVCLKVEFDLNAILDSDYLDSHLTS